VECGRRRPCNISGSRPGRDRQPAASVQSWGPHFFRKRQKSGRLMAARSNYLRLRSHLRDDMKSSGLGGGKGDMCQDRDLLLGKMRSRGLPHKVVIAGVVRWASSWNQE
jgi:hypothetical protein